ncbi:MAG: WD40 repeat domain-containing protein [bacterium]|nr:WD40 repeat domain-containing protein [bacterium]
MNRKRKTAKIILMILLLFPGLARAKSLELTPVWKQSLDAKFYSLAVSPDGKMIATGSTDNKIELWEAATGKLLNTISGLPNMVEVIKFSPDGKVFATIFWHDREVKLWSSADGKLLHTLSGSAAKVTASGFSPDCKYVATGHKDGTLWIWDIRSGKNILASKLLNTENDNEIYAIAINPSNKLSTQNTHNIKDIAAYDWIDIITSDGSSDDKKIKVWSIGKDGLKLLNSVSRSSIYNTLFVSFSPDGKKLLTGDGDGIHLWNNIVELLGKQQAIYSQKDAYFIDETTFLEFSPDGKYILSIGKGVGRAFQIWDVTTKETVDGTGIAVNLAAFAPKGDHIVSCDQNTISYWQVGVKYTFAETHLQASLAGSASPIKTVCFSADGNLVVSGSAEFNPKNGQKDQQSIVVWDTATGEEIAKWTPGYENKSHKGSIVSVAVSPNRHSLASLDEKGDLKIWDINQGEITERTTNKPLFHLNCYSGGAVIFSPDGKQIISGGGDGLVKIWDAATGKLLKTLKDHKASINSVVISPDGMIIASAGGNSFQPSDPGDFSIRLWNAASGKLLAVLRGHSWNVRTLSFSPDGKFLASGGFDNSIRLWDIASRKELKVLREQEGGVSGVAFSPDGKLLASCGNTIKLWAIADGKVIQEISGHTDFVTAIAFSPDGKTLASGSMDGSIKIWLVSGKN